MKVESLVIVDQHATVNLYLGLVLPARHAPGVEWIRSHVNFLSLLLLFHAHVAGFLPYYQAEGKERERKKKGKVAKNCLVTGAKS